jgi:catechol 2,3-dioxygenase-like lactoylglutathione lyase family enzyme
MTKQNRRMKTHLSLRVSDLGRSVRFYQAFFGRPPHKVRPGYANFDVEEPLLKLALTEKAPTPGTGHLDHLGLLVSDTQTVLATKERLQSAGLTAHEEMNTTCCYARQDKFWVHDPDGVEWEVYAVTDDMLDEGAEAETEGQTAAQITCCRN